MVSITYEIYLLWIQTLMREFENISTLIKSDLITKLISLDQEPLRNYSAAVRRQVIGSILAKSVKDGVLKIYDTFDDIVTGENIDVLAVDPAFNKELFQLYVKTKYNSQEIMSK